MGLDATATHNRVSKGPPPSVCLVIVNYMTPAACVRLAEDLLRAPRSSISRAVIVDNSPEHTKAVGHSFSDLQHTGHITVLTSSGNRGFAGGINDAVRAVAADYYWLLNPDTQPLASALESMMLAADRGADIVGSVLLEPSMAVQSSGGRSLVKLGWISHDKRNSAADANAARERSVAWVHGASMLVSRRAFDLLGGLDEQFFLYFEETDFCYRARSLGLRVVVALESRVIHASGGSIAAGALQTARETYLSRNYVLFARRHVSCWQLVVPIWMVTVAILRLARGQWSRARVHVCAAFMGLRGDSGPLSRLSADQGEA